MSGSLNSLLQCAPSAQRTDPRTVPSHPEMRHLSTSYSEEVTSKTWLCASLPNPPVTFLRILPSCRWAAHIQGFLQNMKPCECWPVLVFVCSRLWHPPPAPRPLPSSHTPPSVGPRTTSSAPVLWCPSRSGQRSLVVSSHSLLLFTALEMGFNVQIELIFRIFDKYQIETTSGALRQDTTGKTTVLFSMRWSVLNNIKQGDGPA